ncbi:MAG: sodium:calcium antiporter [Candidatus Woesearchaeota archaeon]
MILFDLVIFLIACIILSQSSTFLVKSLAKISSYLRVNEFTIGFILVAVATSLPETFIGIMSAMAKTPQFSIGNVIGANIIDMTLIVGIGALLSKKIILSSKIIKKDMFMMFFILLIPVFFMFDHYIWNYFGINVEKGISRIDGFILLIIFIFYIYTLIKQETKFSKTISYSSQKEVIKNFAIFIISLVLLLTSSNFVIDYAKIIAIELNLNPLLIGLFIISVGTTLPELMFTIKSVFQKHDEMAIGDIVGSVITNSTLVLGMTAIIHPIIVVPSIYLSSVFFLIFSAFIFLSFSESDNGISWKEGLFLIFFYFVFIIIEAYFKNFAI